MNIVITDDSGSVVHTGPLYKNFVILKGKLRDSKEKNGVHLATLMVSDDKDRDGNWKPSLFCDIASKHLMGADGDVVTVRASYQQRDWTDRDGKKRRAHSFWVWDIIGEPQEQPVRPTTPPPPTVNDVMPFDI